MIHILSPKGIITVLSVVLFTFFVQTVKAGSYRCDGQVINGHSADNPRFKVFGSHNLVVQTCAGHIPSFMCGELSLGGTIIQTKWNEVAKHWSWGRMSYGGDGYFNPARLTLTYKLPDGQNTGNAGTDQRWFEGTCMPIE